MSKIVKIFKIDDFGGPSENPRKIVLGSLKIVKKYKMIPARGPQTKFMQFIISILAAHSMPDSNLLAFR